jgi:uncharacterized membrane protein
MMRWLLLLFGGALLGGIVHLATVMALPRTATHDAYSRLAASAPVNTIVALPAPTPRCRSIPASTLPITRSMTAPPAAARSNST